MNAIERLRDLSEQAQWKCSEDPSCPDCAADTEAVAAVDALYQAANDFLRMNSAERYQALAAAVRRVEGQT